jgi:Cu(I)/Ag(I) efflux system membrane fusion protein
MINDTHDNGPDSESPFGAHTHGRRRALRIALIVALPLATVAVVYAITRAKATPAQAKQQMSGMASPDSARPVALTSDAARRIGVTYAAATIGAMARDIRTVGRVTVDERRARTISPKIDGWVERLFVDFTGQSVRQGDSLLTIYSPMLVTAQEELLLARRLSADVAAGTEEVRRNAQELLSSSRRRLSYWGVSDREIARVEETGAAQRTLTLFASGSGVVVEKQVVAGQRVMAGEVLYKLADLSVVWLEGDIFEQDLAAVRVGDSVSAELESLSGERFTGRITYVYPTVDPETRTARIRIELANPGLRLKPGMYATLHVAGASRAAALTVPRASVLATGERTMVFLKRSDGRLEPRLVRLGATTDERIEILAGLAAGDTVVASATFLIDAESNLRAALGGMGNMPGMEITTPPTAPRPGDSARRSDRKD